MVDTKTKPFVAAPAAKALKGPKATKATKAVKAVIAPNCPNQGLITIQHTGYLFAEAAFTGFKRGLSNQNENPIISKNAVAYNKECDRFYIDKRCVYVHAEKN